MASDRMALFRSPQRIASGREDCLLIALEGNSRSALLQDGREGLLGVGDFAIVDSCRPYSVLFQEGFRHHVLRIPRAEITRRLGSIDAVTGMTISGSTGAGRLASAFCRMLASEADRVTEAASAKMADILLDLFAVALSEHLVSADLCESSVRSAWFVRIRSHIEEHLADPELSRPGIAAALGISVRYLTDIFRSHGLSVSSYIWERRLHKCAKALADPAQRGRSITGIAFGWGFSDMSHFGRAFKAQYGLSPREFRESSRAASDGDAGDGR